MIQPAAPGTSRSAGGQRSTREFGDLLARLGGADLAVLEKVPVERIRGRFVQMALVLLSTTGLAVLSMSFALTAGLDLSPFAAVPCGLVWGFIILNLDRMLILNLVTRGGVRQVVAMVTPRILIAALLGIVISTPLVLQVFQTEIQAQIAITNVERNQDLGGSVNSTGIGVELDRVRTEIAENEAILRGDVQGITTPEVAAQERYLAEAEATYATRLAASDALYAQWQCELEGAACAGSTDKSGNGPLSRALKTQYDTAIRQTNEAQRAVDAARADLDGARADAGATTDTVVAQAQAEAERLLPGLRARETELAAAFNTALDGGTRSIQVDDGLLAQITALHDLGDENLSALLTHLAVGLLFFMIELLPVLVKVMTSVGPPSVYDRVRELDDNQLVDGAKIRQRAETKQRDEDERRNVAEAGKVRAIEDDMRARERKLGFRANTHVANEMEKILDAALAQWSLDVAKTLHRVTSAAAQQSNGTQQGIAPGANGSSSGGSAPTPAATQATVRSNFNLPNGTKL